MKLEIESDETGKISESSAQHSKQEDFSPMPKAKPADTNDISILWGQLLNNVSSAPARALLKQWANPIKITPDETVLTIKNEILMTQFVSGNKKKILTEALDTLFSQSNSNIIVRLPQPGDEQIKAITSQPRSPRHIESNVKPEQKVSDEEDGFSEEETQQIKPKSSEELKNKHSGHLVGHSDQVNMIIDLFDGKIID